MDRRKAWRRVGLWALVVAWMGLIFCFSLEPDYQSDQTSGGVIRCLLTILDGGFSGLSPSEQVLRMEGWSFAVRKLAHLLLFAALGFLIFGAFSVDLPPRRAFHGAVLLGVVRGVLDEIQQAFIPGRSCEFRDMCIDAVGVLLGAACLWLMLHLIQRKKLKR